MPKKKLKRKIGRPDLYKPEYCQQLLDYFSGEPFIEKEINHTNKKGDEWTTYEEVANPAPFFQGFARQLKVSRDTLHEWGKKHPEFSDAFKQAKDLQEQFIATNALKGLYNASMTIFMLKNVAGWRDVHDVRTPGGEQGKPSFLDFLINGVPKKGKE